MTLDRFVCDRVYFPPCKVTVGCVRSKASVRSHISHDIIMNIVVKGGIFEFIGLGGTKNWILLHDSRK